MAAEPAEENNNITNDKFYSPIWKRDGEVNAYVVYSQSNDPDYSGGELGMVYNVFEHASLRSGIEYSKHNQIRENIFLGFNLGLRTRTGYRLSPFIGLGIYVGFLSEEKDRAEREVYGYYRRDGTYGGTFDDVLCSVYPEAGFVFWIRNNLGLTGSYKYQITTAGRDYDFGSISIGLTFAIEE